IHFSPRGIERIKERWEIEVLRALQRPERRFVRREPERVLMPLTPLRLRGPMDRQLSLRLDPSRRTRRLGLRSLLLLRARPTRRLGRLAGPTVDGALWFLDHAMDTNRNPERVARRLSFQLLSRAMPSPMRKALWLVRSVASIGVRQR